MIRSRGRTKERDRERQARREEIRRANELSLEIQRRNTVKWGEVVATPRPAGSTGREASRRRERRRQQFR